MIVALLLLAAVQSLYTSSFWEKKGINVRDQLLDDENTQAVYLQTSCTDVDLSVPPYSHNGVVMSGYLNVNKAGSGLGFIFYGKEGASKATLKNFPTIIWLNGGPGSSSQLGNFMELGPHFVRPAAMAPYEIVKNNYTWVKEYNVIFVDQPVGTGLSYADPQHPSPYCKNMTDVANDFYYALKELYQNPNGCFNKSESPERIPSSCSERAMPEKNKGFLTGLKGVAIGDGFTHPYHILTQERFRQWVDLHDTFDLALDLIVNMSGGVNVYDITKYREYPVELIASFLESPDNKKRFALNDGVTFGKQSGNVYEALYADFMYQYVHLVEMLLEAKVNVLIYNGQNDLIVETPGTFKWPWKVKDKVAGFYKIVGNLELRTVNDAGHLVPMDQGENSLEMVKSFVKRSL
ncbi:serine carboxypeptidase-like 48 [Nymphaea colorata]|nr:serine carboxypeptidase-like 48 [Nymphaea colorata]